MRYLLPSLLALACTATPTGGGWELSGGAEGGTSKEYTPVPHPDLGVEITEWPERLDLAQRVSSCNGLDFLFVIDNSGSMSDEQEALAASVPGFIQNLNTIGVASEGGLHIGVVTTDAYQWNAEECRSLGATVTSIGGPNGVEECGPYASGWRFMTEDDDLETAFVCAASVGTYGSGEERPMDAVIEALDEWQNRVGGCNEGFHRKPVFTDTGGFSTNLVVVILTDEDDQSSSDDPVTWVEHLSWVRGTSLEDVVFVMLIRDAEVCLSDAPKLNEFASLVPYSYVGSICGTDYSAMLAGAAFVVRESCGFEHDPEQ